MREFHVSTDNKSCFKEITDRTFEQVVDNRINKLINQLKSKKIMASKNQAKKIDEFIFKLESKPINEHITIDIDNIFADVFIKDCGENDPNREFQIYKNIPGHNSVRIYYDRKEEHSGTNSKQPS